MKAKILVTSALILVALLASPVNAQSSADNDGPVTAFVTVDLDAGNPLDPFIVSLNGGGPIDASTLSEGCVGYVTEKPTLTVNWSGEAEAVEAFFTSEHDPILVVESPDGSVLCNDDANDLLLDPTITLKAPAEGEYKIWVGSYDEGQLIPGILALTTRPDVNLGTFDLGGLIEREPIAKELIKSEAAAPKLLPREAISNTGTVTDTSAVSLTTVALASEQLPFSTTVTVSGTIPAFEYESLGDMCNGLLEPLPSLIFDLTGEEEDLDIFFDSDSDSTLLVETPDGTILCNDDSERDDVANDEIEEDVNLNPLVSIANATPGRYSVYVGRLNDGAIVNGTLNVTNAPVPMPVLSGEEQ